MKNFTVILSLENKKNGLEKVWKKSWILFTKKCTNPVYLSGQKLFMKYIFFNPKMFEISLQG